MGSKSEAGIFLGYSINNKAYKVYNKCFMVTMESINVVIDDTPEEKEEEDDEVSPQQIDVSSHVPLKESDIVHEVTNVDDL